MKRFLLICFGLSVGAFGLLVVVLLSASIYFHGASKPDPRVVQSLQNAAVKGTPIIQAIYDYRNRTELFPEKLADLTRYSTVGVDARNWTYEWSYWQWSLQYTGSDMHATNTLPPPPSLSYHWDHMDRGTGWDVSGKMYMDAQITATIAIPKPLERTPQERYGAFVAEIQWRIARDPKNPIHHQGLISRRILEKDLEAALSDAIRMHERRLQPVWELRVSSHLLHRLNRDNWALRELAHAAEDNPTFIQYFGLAMAYKDVDQHLDAIHAIEKGYSYPFGSTTEPPSYVPQYYYCIAAAYAYRQKQYSLAIRICGDWQKGDGECSYYAIRGASNLAMGNMDAAMQDINLAVAANKEGATWACNLEPLAAAAKAKQTAFFWDPGPDMPTAEATDLLVAYH